MFETYQLENVQKYNQRHRLSIERPLKKYRRLIFTRCITEGIIVTLFTYIGLYLGPLDDLRVFVWPHTGVLLGLLFLRGVRILPWIWIGSLIACFQVVTFTQTCLLSLLITLSSYIPYIVLTKCVGAVVPLSRAQTLIKTIALVLVLGMPLGWLHYYVYAFQGNYSAVEQWMVALSAALGLILFLPICLIWDTHIPGRTHQTSKRWLLIWGLIILLSNSTYSLFTDLNLIVTGLIASMMLIWIITWLYGQMGCTLVGVITGAFILAWKDLPGAVLFESYSYAPIIVQSVLLLNVFACLYISTLRKEAYFEKFVQTFSERQNEYSS